MLLCPAFVHHTHLSGCYRAEEMPHEVQNKLAGCLPTAQNRHRMFQKLIWGYRKQQLVHNLPTRLCNLICPQSNSGATVHASCAVSKRCSQRTLQRSLHTLVSAQTDMQAGRLLMQNQLEASFKHLLSSQPGSVHEYQCFGKCALLCLLPGGTNTMFLDTCSPSG